LPSQAPPAFAGSTHGHAAPHVLTTSARTAAPASGASSAAFSPSASTFGSAFAGFGGGPASGTAFAASSFLPPHAPASASTRIHRRI
jgi:hypothetical protein